MAPRPSQDIYAETLAVFDRREQRYEPLTTPEVADALDAKRRTVYKRLQKLVDRGKLKTKETGSNSRVWWRPPADSSSTTSSGVDNEREPRSKNESSDERMRQESEKTGQEQPQLAERRQAHVDYREIFETIPDGVTLHDPTNGTIIDANQQFCEMLGYTREELLTLDLEAIHADVPPYTNDRAKQYIQQAATDGPQTFEWLDQTKAGEQLPVEVHLRRTTIDDEDRILAVIRDITDRKQQGEELERRSRAMESAIDGMAIVDEDGEYIYVNETHASVYGYDDREAFIGEHWQMCYDEDELPRFEDDIIPTLYEEGAWRGEAIGQRKDGTTFPQELSLTLTDDGGLVCVVRDTTARKERERELERQRNQLTALNHLNDVVRGITEAVIDQSTREEIEHVVCTRLAESDSYQFAWICAADSRMQLEPRMEAGIDGYLDEIALSSDPDDPTGQGPTGTAVRTQEIQITQNALDDPNFEPWHQQAREYGYRSEAAIPLVHNDTLYGVLGVYSERPNAFDEEEQEVIGQLGEVVGHAIAAVDRKRALMSDEVVELTVQIPKLLATLDLSVTTDETIIFKRTIPLSDDEYLAYGTATADAMEVIHALSDRLPDWNAVRTIDETDGEVRFELHYAEPPIASIVADHGGHVEVARIENGAYSATIHLPPGTDVRRTVAGIRETYPDIETISQQQVAREESSPRQTLSVLAEKLTGRQRASLEAGYFGGFFEWPRDRSGEEVAESLGIGASTFHQHVRKAEKKLLDVVFAEN